MTSRDSTRPLASVLTQIVSEVAYLLQTEIRLAKAEAAEKLSLLANGATLIGIAAVLLLPGLFVLFLAAASWLEAAGMPYRWAILLVGVVVVAIGVGLALKGVNNLKGSSLVPKRTMDQMRADLAVVKEQVQ